MLAKMKRAIVGILLAAAALAWPARTEAAFPIHSAEQLHEIFFLLGMNFEYIGKPAGQLGYFFPGDAKEQAIYESHVEKLRLSLGLKSTSNVWNIVDSFYKKSGVYGADAKVYFISD